MHNLVRILCPYSRPTHCTAHRVQQIPLRCICTGRHCCFCSALAAALLLWPLHLRLHNFIHLHLAILSEHRAILQTRKAAASITRQRHDNAWPAYVSIPQQNKHMPQPGLAQLLLVHESAMLCACASSCRPPCQPPTKQHCRHGVLAGAGHSSLHNCICSSSQRRRDQQSLIPEYAQQLTCVWYTSCCWQSMHRVVKQPGHDSMASAVRPLRCCTAQASSASSAQHNMHIVHTGSNHQLPTAVQ